LGRTSTGYVDLPLHGTRPNLNAFAKRFVESAKFECLERMVLLGERHLRARPSESLSFIIMNNDRTKVWPTNSSRPRQPWSEPARSNVASAWLLVSFRWPSVVYALDILGWDFFFALSVLFAAAVFGGSRLTVSIRGVMTASGVLALAGLGGVVTGDMQLRNIGIVGYLGGFWSSRACWPSCSLKPNRQGSRRPRRTVIDIHNDLTAPLGQRAGNPCGSRNRVAGVTQPTQVSP
jgi:hypothetical protein